MNTTDDDAIRFLEIVGHRGSGKTTIESLCYVIYAALEKAKLYPFVILCGDTSMQVGMNMANVKEELENNKLLIEDYGTIYQNEKVNDKSPEEKTLESDEEWQKRNMLLANGVRIIGRSRGQKVRGLRHRQHRPKLVVVDDPEDSEWVKEKENRDKTEAWLRGEIMPGIDPHTGRLILVGNYLHDDALMARAKGWGIFKVIEIPIIGKDMRCVWPAMYPTREKLIEKRQQMGPIAWLREMMLLAVSDEGQEIKPSDITYYDKLPEASRGLRGHGVDLAISQKQTADYTAMVDGDVYYPESAGPRIYILPFPTNARLNFGQTIDLIVTRHRSGGQHLFFIEAVSYQKAAIEELDRRGVNVEGVQPLSDKRARLRVAAPHIRNATVLFPLTGCEALLSQLFNFGTEAHDDMVDGLVYLILGLLKDGIDQKVVHWI